MTAAGWRAVLALPTNVLVVIPGLLLWWSGDGRIAGPSSPQLWGALACLGAGLGLMVSTIRLFDRVGGGTLAPWSPTQRLVVEGPYRYVRNPMITGVLLNLVGEALLFRSQALAGWLVAFFLGNAVYFLLLEEPGLEKRFGEEYARYKRAVPRWIPRRTPWRDPGS